MKIIFSNGKGGVTVMSPAPDWESRMLELGKKDVPKGLPFKIVEDSDIPEYLTTALKTQQQPVSLKRHSRNAL